MNKTINVSRNSKDKRKAYESLLILLLTIALFVTATYAWFTDSAYSKGNKLFAGNLYIDIVASKDDLLNAGHVEGELNTEFGNPYTRTLTDGTSTDYYYITDKEANVVNIYNMEPGQYRKVSIDYLNTGDLAFKTVGALKVEGQLDAFDTLIKQVDLNYKVYRNKFSVNASSTEVKEEEAEPHDEPEQFNSVTVDANDTIDPKLIYEANNDDDYSNNYYETENGLSYDEYFYRFDKAYSRIENIIVQEADKQEGVNYKEVYKRVPTAEVGNYDTVSLGFIPENYGCLSQILEVYVTTNASELTKGHDSAYYFGTVDQFAYLIENGPAAIENIEDLTIEKFNYLLDTYNSNYPLPSEYNTPDYIYKLMLNNKDANLYDDYERYLACGSGYCLPIETITNADKKVDPNTTVKVYTNSVFEGGYELVEASEMGNLEFILYMPKDAGDEYQNCTLSLSLGGTATQVEYEVDDLGIMIYDKTRPVLYNYQAGDIVGFKLPGEDLDDSSYGRIIRRSGSSVDLVLVGDNTMKTPFFASEIIDEKTSSNLLDIYGKVKIKDLSQGTYIGLYKDSALNLVNDIISFEVTGKVSDGIIKYFVEEFGGEIIDDNHIKVPSQDGKGYVTITFDEFKEQMIEMFELEFDEEELLKGFGEFEYAQDVYELVYYYEISKEGNLIEVGNKNQAQYLIKDSETKTNKSYGVRKVLTLDPVKTMFKPLTIQDLVDGIGKTTSTFEDIDKFVYGYANAPDDYYAPDMWLADGFFLSPEVQKAFESITHSHLKYPLGLCVSYGNGLLFGWSLEYDENTIKSNESGLFDSPYIQKEASFVTRVNLKETNILFEKIAKWPDDFKDFEYEKKEGKSEPTVDIILTSEESPYLPLIKNKTDSITDYKVNTLIPDKSKKESLIDFINKYITSDAECMVIELPNDIEQQAKIFEISDNIKKDIIYIGTCYQLSGKSNVEFDRIDLCASPVDYFTLFTINDMGLSRIDLKNARFIYPNYDCDLLEAPFVNVFDRDIAINCFNYYEWDDSYLYDSETIDYLCVANSEHNLKSEFFKSNQIDTVVVPYYSSDRYTIDNYQRFISYVNDDSFDLSANDPFNVYVYFVQGESFSKTIQPIVDEYNNETLNYPNFKTVKAIYRNDDNIVSNLFSELESRMTDSSLDHIRREKVSIYQGSAVIK